MSIVRIVSVFCDAAPCLMWVAETDEGPAVARKIARANGWVRRDGLDLCPDHKATHPETCWCGGTGFRENGATCNMTEEIP